MINNPEWHKMKDEELSRKLDESINTRLQIEHLDYAKYVERIVARHNFKFPDDIIIEPQQIRFKLDFFSKYIAEFIEEDDIMSGFLSGSPYFKARFAFELYNYFLENKDNIYQIVKKRDGSYEFKLLDSFVNNKVVLKSMFDGCKVATIKLLNLTRELEERISHNESVEIIEAFLNAHEEIDLGWVNGLKENCLFWAAQKNNPDLIKVLLKRMHISDINNINEKNGYSPLLYAIANSYSEAAKALIEDKNTDITLQSASGADALLIAISTKQENIALMLLEHEHAKQVVNHSFISKTAQGVELTRTPLIMAANQENLALVEKLLSLGADPTIKISQDGATALHTISEFADARLFTSLIKESLEKLEFDDKICSIMIGYLIESAAKLKQEQVEKYQEKIALIKYLVFHDKIKISFALEGANLLHQAIYQNMWEVAEAIIDAVTKTEKNGQIDLFATDKDGSTIIHLVAHKILAAHRSGNNKLESDFKSKFEYLLLHIPDQDSTKAIEAKNTNGQTVMHVSAASGSFETCLYFGQKGASLYSQDKNGDTPAHVAIQSYNSDAFYYLFGAGGATYNHQNNSESTIFLTALDQLCGSQFVADESKNQILVKIINMIYKSTKVDFKIVDDRQDSALILAAGCGLTDICDGLIETHEATTAANIDGFNALHSACMRGKIETVQLLLTKEIFKSQLDTKTTDGGGKGSTALHYAVLSGNLELVTYLCDQGAAINAANEEGLTPIFVSTNADNLEMFQYLQSKGADLSLKSTNGATVFDNAILMGAKDILTYAIDELHIDINSKTHFSDYPLLNAATLGKDLAFLAFLIEEKHADPFLAKNSFGRTALHELVMMICKEMEQSTVNHEDKNYIDTITLLKEKIKMLSFINAYDGKRLVDENDTKFYSNPLLSAIADFGNLEMTKFLLDECGADLNYKATASGITHNLNSIGIAIHYKKFDIAEFLLSREGVNLYIQDYEENNLLQMAASAGNFDFIRKIMYEHEKEFLHMSNHINNIGCNFLHLVIQCQERYLKKATLIEEASDFLKRINEDLWNEVMHHQKDSVKHLSVAEEIYESPNLYYFSNSIAKTKAKLVAEKHRLGIDRIESDVAVLKTDVAVLKTDVAEIRADVAELRTEFRDGLDVLRTNSSVGFDKILGLLSEQQHERHKGSHLELLGASTAHHNSDSDYE